jgi:transposase
MPRRARPPLPLQRRQALEAELRLYAEMEQRAALDKYVHVSRAFDAGMSVREIAEVYGIGHATAARWKDAGEREREKRRSGDTERSGELQPDG